MPRRPDRQLAEREALLWPLGERRLPGQVDERDRRIAEQQPGEGRHRWAGESIAVAVRRWPRTRVRSSSEPLPQVGRDRRVVAERLVEVAGIGPVMAGGHLDEGGAELSPDPLGLLHEQVADAALPLAGVDDEGHDPDDPVGLLEARQGVEGDEAEDRALVVRDDRPGSAARRTAQRRSTMSDGPDG